MRFQRYRPEIQQLLDDGEALLARIDERERRQAERARADDAIAREAAEREREALLEATGAKMRYRRENDIEVYSVVRPAGRRIHGICSTSRPNSHGYALLSRGCEIELPIPLLTSHAPGPIGEVVLVRKRAAELYCQCLLFDNEAGNYAWTLIEAGKLISLSAAAEPQSLKLQATVDGIKFYDQWRLAEISLCERGANADCCDVVEILDTDGTSRRPPRAQQPAKAEPPEPPKPVEVTISVPVRDEKGRIVRMETRKVVEEQEVTAKEPPWRGVWKPGFTYPKGAFVTDRGALWFALEPTTTRPGGKNAAWKMAVISGQRPT